MLSPADERVVVGSGRPVDRQEIVADVALGGRVEYRAAGRAARARVPWSASSVFTAKGVLYSVPSRLAGHRLKVRLYSAHVEAWLGGVKVFECERLYGSTENRQPKRIDWRHMLPSLKRKPGAFARWVLRDTMFPRTAELLPPVQQQP